MPWPWYGLACALANDPRIVNTVKAIDAQLKMDFAVKVEAQITRYRG